MTDKPVNPYAFGFEGSTTLEYGMTLRDYFAAAALTGYRCAYHQWYEKVGATGKMAAPKQIARWSYADADAMLRARGQS